MNNQPIHKIRPDGTQEWLLNGKLHRADGPAVIYPTGPQFWYRNGTLHREDGPALIYKSGSHSWYLNDYVIYSMKEYQEKLKLSDQDMTALILKYGNGNINSQ